MHRILSETLNQQTTPTTPPPPKKKKKWSNIHLKSIIAPKVAVIVLEINK